MVPGMNVLAILFGYLTNDILFSFLIFVSLNLLWSTTSWLTYKKIFLNKFEKSFKEDKLFMVLQHWS